MGQFKNLVIGVNQIVDDQAQYSEGMGIHSTRTYGMMDGLSLALSILREVRTLTGEEVSDVEREMIWYAVDRLREEHWTPTLELPVNSAQ